MKTEIELKQELEVLKQKYGSVREMLVYLDTDDDSKTATIFLKKPDKTTRSIVGKVFINKSKIHFESNSSINYQSTTNLSAKLFLAIHVSSANLNSAFSIIISVRSVIAFLL